MATKLVTKGGQRAVDEVVLAAWAEPCAQRSTEHRGRNQPVDGRRECPALTNSIRSFSSVKMMIRRSMGPYMQALGDPGVTTQQLDEVLSVGGRARMPQPRRRGKERSHDGSSAENLASETDSYEW